MTRQGSSRPLVITYLYYVIGALWLLTAAVILVGLIPAIIIGSWVGIHSLLILTGVIQ